MAVTTGEYYNLVRLELGHHYIDILWVLAIHPRGSRPHFVIGYLISFSQLCGARVPSSSLPSYPHHLWTPPSSSPLPYVSRQPHDLLTPEFPVNF